MVTNQRLQAKCCCSQPSTDMLNLKTLPKPGPKNGIFEHSFTSCCARCPGIAGGQTDKFRGLAMWTEKLIEL
eukprot:5791615-Amphidinium_carterae.2